MKKLLAFAAALSLASSVSVVVPTVATAAPGNGNSGVAKACHTAAAAFGISEGNCIQLSKGNDNANSLCHLWQGPQGTAIFGIPYPFASFGECVSFFNSNN